MSSYASISPEKLARLIGSPKGPALVDVRDSEDFSADSRFIPGSTRRDPASIADWATSFAGASVVVISRSGEKRGHGVAVWLRHAGIAAETLEGGHEAWAKAGLPLILESKLPPRDAQGRTIWVTRSRPKVDRIAVPWLIRRFIDPGAIFLFVPVSEVAAVADLYKAAAFDVEGAFWGHRGDRCTFDAFVEELGLETDALRRLATIVRGADTARPDIAPESAGLLAASLGLSRLYSDDLEQLDAGLGLYDALYRWARDAVDEAHVSHVGKSGRAR